MAVVTVAGVCIAVCAMKYRHEAEAGDPGDYWLARYTLATAG